MRVPFLLAASATFSLLGGPAMAAERYWPPITDPPTNAWQPGRWVWADLVTDDVGAAAEFYGKVLGWTFATTGGDDDRDTYTLVLANGRPIGGMLFPAGKVAAETVAGRWIGFISVPDVRAAGAAVEKAGGKAVMPPRPLGSRGDAAVFADPEGALFGTIHSAAGDPEDYFGDEREWMWVELWATDPAKMGEFYRAVGGYATEPAADVAGLAQLRLKAGGRLRAGILRKPKPEIRSAWLPYVRVTDVAATAAKAREAGGRVVLGPTEARGHPMAIIVDPTGAPFAVAEWAGR
jgi:predicted enzyme related to lactoylglutathione lyase